MKQKSLPFKKGLPVIWLTEDYGRISLMEGEVTVVTTKDGETVVYVRAPDQWGGYWKRSFSPVAGMFQADPYPIWKLMPLNGQNVKKLKKRAEKATKLFREYEESYRKISTEVEQEARSWQSTEIARRVSALPNGPKFLKNVVARLGFKRPKDGVKVRTKKGGEVPTVK